MKSAGDVVTEGWEQIPAAPSLNGVFVVALATLLATLVYVRPMLKGGEKLIMSCYMVTIGDI